MTINSKLILLDNLGSYELSRFGCSSESIAILQI